MPLDDAQRQEVLDEEHLRLLSIGYVVSGAMNALFSLLGLVYMLMGLVMSMAMKAIPTPPGQPGPEIMGWFFGAIGLFLFGIMVTAAVLKLVVAHRLRRRRSRTLCMVVGGLSCLEIPYGTALGVATLVVLSRPAVAESFDRA